MLYPALSLRLLIMFQAIANTISNIINSPPTIVWTRIKINYESSVDDEYDKLLAVAVTEAKA